MSLQKELRAQGDFLFKYRSYLPVVIILIGIGVYIQNIMDGSLASGKSAEIYKLCCLAVCFIGQYIRAHAIGHAAANTSGRNTSVGQVAEAVNTSGWYSICRHPLYVGNFFMWLGIAGFTQEPWFLVAFVFIYWVYYERIMFAEEAFLIDKYGEEYTNWSAHTPAFWPKFGQWKSPIYPFSWAKIIRQEKSGLLNLFLILFIFEVIRSYMVTGEFLNMEPYWYILFLASVVWYIIIKTLQKTTKIFEGR
tara:strand:+ start:10116 stop:10862 length:747 start_codon:yes stop_codon:yes gene_type:complete